MDIPITNNTLFQNGTLMEVAANRPQWHLPASYCVDILIRNTENPVRPRLMALVCYPDETPEDSAVLHIVYAVGELISKDPQIRLGNRVITINVS